MGIKRNPIPNLTLPLKGRENASTLALRERGRVRVVNPNGGINDR
jgi:hypothetical protein